MTIYLFTQPTIERGRIFFLQSRKLTRNWTTFFLSNWVFFYYFFFFFFTGFSTDTCHTTASFKRQVFPSSLSLQVDFSHWNKLVEKLSVFLGNFHVQHEKSFPFYKHKQKSKSSLSFSNVKSLFPVELFSCKLM